MGHLKSKTKPKIKYSGLLTPLFALRRKEDLGIGDTYSLKLLIKLANKIGISKIQVLPIAALSRSDTSPYSAVSSFALEYTTLEIRQDLIPGLNKDDYERIIAKADLADLRKGPVNYQRVRTLKTELLECAFNNFNHIISKEYNDFLTSEYSWSSDYSLWQAIVDYKISIQKLGPYKAEDWRNWEEKFQSPQKARKLINQDNTLSLYLENRIRYHLFVQWLLANQWKEVKQFATENKIKLIGDIPIGTNRNGADTWINSDLFVELYMAVVPINSKPDKIFPDNTFRFPFNLAPQIKLIGDSHYYTYLEQDMYLQKFGQHWGMNYFNYERMEKDNYLWFRNKFRQQSHYFHILRIDSAWHYECMFTVPWNSSDKDQIKEMTYEEVFKKYGYIGKILPSEDPVQNSKRVQKIFRLIKENVGDSDIWAEICGPTSLEFPNIIMNLDIASIYLVTLKLHQWYLSIPDLENWPYNSVSMFTNHDAPPIITELKRLNLEIANNNESVKSDLEKYYQLAGLNISQEISITDLADNIISAICAKSNSADVIFIITDILELDLEFNRPNVGSDQKWADKPGIYCWTERIPYTLEDLLEIKGVYTKALNNFEEILKRTKRSTLN